MNKRTFYHIIKWGIALGACVWLVYQLATYDAYPALWDTLRGMTGMQVLAIVACVALMPLNMTLEAWRWKTLVPMSWRDAHRQVYYSKLAGMITPWRLGEYPARGVLMANGEREDGDSVWPKVLSMGVVGSVTMTAAIVIAGAIGLAFSPSVFAYLGGSYLYSLCAVVAILCGLFLLLPKALKKYVSVHNDLLIRSTAQSLVRLACWCVQLALVLFSLGGLGSLGILGSLAKCPVYYLLVTVTPNVPVVEAGVRGAWAMLVFGSVNAALAGVLLWVINTLLPCLIWPFLRKNDKKFA